MPGRDEKTKWKVIERIYRQQEEPDAIFSSVGYKVKSEDGREAFLKVTDVDLITQAKYTMFERTMTALNQHQVERKLLEHCRGNNMDRIAFAIDYGETIIVDKGTKEAIFYIVFDLAECDVRVQVDKRAQFDIAWIYVALHDLSVAIQQLHSGNVTHNDIKPANFLVFLRDLKFKERLQKLADLGCATSPLMVSIYDDAVCAGDPDYAAPEIMYGKKADASLRTFAARRCVDIYHLGSMIFFLVTGRMLTPEIIRYLPPEQRPPADENDWANDFAEVIPYWREAFGRVLVDLKGKLPADDNGDLTPAGEALLSAMVQLGEPDPTLRGHPNNQVGHKDRLSVEQYITLFNSLHRRAMH